ncbi:MAG: reverse transcriptase-like protein, partial [Chlamydiae bacterium]|nr:reverse transcriptase-like protein [Chlamydiota bacterium]
TDTTVSDAQVLSLAEKRAKEIAFPINYKLSSDDIVSKMLKFRNLNQQKSRNDYFVWSWSNRQSYENDEIGIIESKLDLANQILPFFEAAGFVWSIKGTKPLKFTSDKEELSATLHFDGGAVPNPGNAGCGFVVCLDGGKCHKGGKFIGRATNNIAEYTGLLEGLKLAQTLGVTSLKVFGDSKLVINQMKGEWAVKQPEIAIIKNKCDEESKKFKTISFTHVLREYNKDADQLADLAISQKKDYSSSH